MIYDLVFVSIAQQGYAFDGIRLDFIIVMAAHSIN
jgi:hypothetical protein